MNYKLLLFYAIKTVVQCNSLDIRCDMTEHFLKKINEKTRVLS